MRYLVYIEISGVKTQSYFGLIKAHMEIWTIGLLLKRQEKLESSKRAKFLVSIDAEQSMATGDPGYGLVVFCRLIHQGK